MKDDIGDRMKGNYENRTRYYLPRRTYTILRLDQKCGHTYCKGLNRPFDAGYMEDMNEAVKAMLPQLQGAQFAYLQSDEISILLTDFASPQTDAWFDGNIQKMSSVAASILTAEFNRRRYARYIWDTTDDGMVMVSGRGTKNVKIENNKWQLVEQDWFFIDNCPNAYFDCRTFSIPDRAEVMNYFRWRQKDCIKNSTSMAALTKYSHKELEGKNTSDKHEMLFQKGINWATDFTDAEKNGRILTKEEYDATVASPVMGGEHRKDTVKRTRWIATGAWVFTKDEGKLLGMIPDYE